MLYTGTTRGVARHLFLVGGHRLDFGRGNPLKWSFFDLLCYDEKKNFGMGNGPSLPPPGYAPGYRHSAISCTPKSTSCTLNICYSKLFRSWTVYFANIGSTQHWEPHRMNCYFVRTQPEQQDHCTYDLFWEAACLFSTFQSQTMGPLVSLLPITVSLTESCSQLMDYT